MRKYIYHCDCCRKQAEQETDLILIEISLGSQNGITYKEVCVECWSTYMNKIADVAKELFEKSPK